MKPLFQITVKAGIAASKEKDAELLDLNHMMKTRRYKVQVTMGLPDRS